MELRPTNADLGPRQPTVQPGRNVISAMQNGDEAAFHAFYTATNGLLFAILLHVLSHTQIAEEVLSELYEEVKRKATWFNRHREQRLTLLLLIAHRRAVERLCRERPSQYGLPSHGQRKSIRGNAYINITEHRRIIRSMLEAIPNLQRRMIELAFFSGMNNFEIAKELHVPCELVEEGIRSGTLRFFCAFRSLGFSGEPPLKHSDDISHRNC